MYRITARSWNLVKAPRGVVIVLVSLVVTAQILFLYVVGPGRVAPTFTAVQPDSLQYICYGLHLSGLDARDISSIATPLLDRFGYQEVTCLAPEFSSALVWQVYPRLLLPSLIGLSSWLPFTFAPLIPSIGIFVLLAVLWLVPEKSPDASVWSKGTVALTILALLPYLSVSLVLWPAAVLTEGPFTLLSLVAVLTLFRIHEWSPRLSISVLAVCGLALMTTRQSWPLVAGLWTIGAVCLLSRSRKLNLGMRLLSILISLLLFSSIAYLIAATIERLTVPAGLKSLQPYVNEGLPSSIDAWIGITEGALSSTISDIMVAVGRADLLSPLTVLAALVCLVIIVRSRTWRITFLLVIQWMLGLYAVGLVSYDFGATGTHFRFLVPAIFSTLLATRLQSREQRSGVSFL